MKQRKIWTVLLLGLVLALSISACGGGTPKVDWDLKVGGAVGIPLTLSYADLVEMPQVDLTDVLMEKSLGEDETASWSGVLLDEVFKKAEVTDFASITATAADGYAIEITKDETQGGIVALKKDGEWLTTAEPDKGPIRLVCPETPANRWVFQIQAIEVNP